MFWKYRLYRRTIYTVTHNRNIVQNIYIILISIILGNAVTFPFPVMIQATVWASEFAIHIGYPRHIELADVLNYIEGTRLRIT